MAFILAITLHRKVEQSAHNWALLWMMAACTSFGSMFYALPLVQTTITSIIVGAIITGLASVWVILGWGAAYSRITVREATVLTAGSFLVAGVLYLLIEIAHNTHHSSLMVFAAGRFVIHAGMALGESTALSLADNMPLSSSSRSSYSS